VYSVYNDGFTRKLRPTFSKKLIDLGLSPESAEKYKQASFESTTKLAIDYSDAAVIAHEDINENVLTHIKNSQKPHFVHKDEQYVDDYFTLYNNIL
jgi:starch synthase